MKVITEIIFRIKFNRTVKKNYGILCDELLEANSNRLWYQANDMAVHDLLPNLGSSTAPVFETKEDHDVYVYSQILHRHPYKKTKIERLR